MLKRPASGADGRAEGRVQDMGKNALRGGIAVVIGALCVSCTTAGPFVTSISNAGNGRLVVEKCMAEFNAWLGVLTTKDCKSHQIKVDTPAQSHRSERQAPAKYRRYR